MTTTVCYGWSEYLNIFNNTTKPIHYYAKPKGSSGIHPSEATIAPFSKLTIRITDGTLSRFRRWQSEGHIYLNNFKFKYHGYAHFHSLTTLKAQTQNSQATLRTNSRRDCQGPKNCIIFNPNFAWVKKALSLQSRIDRFEPLNRMQQLSTHNSYISKAYGKTYRVDPNQHLSLTEQLNLGIRALELDVHYIHPPGDILLCHGHEIHSRRTVTAGCVEWDNKLSKGLTEIKHFITTNKAPSLLITLYLDGSIRSHLNLFEAHIKDGLGNLVFTRQDLASYLRDHNYGAEPSGTLTTDKLSKQAITGLGKHVLILAKEGDFDDSQYVFVRTVKNIELPYDHGIHHVKEADCGVSAFQLDPTHDSLWRVFGDRTRFSGGGSDDITFEDVQKLKRCRFNFISLDKLDEHDARLASLVWLWGQGYPINQDGYAVLDTKRGWLRNDINTDHLPALCHDTTQDLQHGWRVADSIDACHELGNQFKFAVPTTSYAMAAIAAQNFTQPYLLVNYRSIKNTW